MIDERLQDQAVLYVLSALPSEEAQEFGRALAANPEIQEFVVKLSPATLALSGSVPAARPRPELRAKILDSLPAPSAPIPLPTRQTSSVSWLPWALAACFAIGCLVLLSQENQLRQRAADQARQIDSLNQLAQVLESSTNNLQQTVLALQETNRLANLRIAMLNSIGGAPAKTVGVTLWDNQKQSGVFMAQNLEVLPDNKDYELWVIDSDRHPVAAGVFHVLDNGSVRMEFKPNQLVKTAGQFAVTREDKGGVNSPTMTAMVMAGQ